MAISVDMNEAGVRLRELVELIAAGEQVILTDRGVQVARLAPPEGSRESDDGGGEKLRDSKAFEAAGFDRGKKETPGK